MGSESPTQSLILGLYSDGGSHYEYGKKKTGWFLFFFLSTVLLPALVWEDDRAQAVGHCHYFCLFVWKG